MLEWLPINIKVKGNFIDLWDGSTCNSSAHAEAEVAASCCLPTGVIKKLSLGFSCLLFCFSKLFMDGRKTLPCSASVFEVAELSELFLLCLGRMKTPSLEAFKNTPDKFMPSKELIFLTLLGSKRVD